MSRKRVFSSALSVVHLEFVTEVFAAFALDIESFQY